MMQRDIFYLGKDKIMIELVNTGGNMVALYHRIFRRENFETAANDLMGLIYQAQIDEPNEARALFVDIDGHRNEAGGFDEDMRELQTEFAIEVLLQFVEELHFPLMELKNPKGQNNNVPRKLLIGNQQNERDTSLEQLYLENYSNTEFLSEPDVYQYMEAVSSFLQNYTESMKYERDKEMYDAFGWLGMWRRHMNDLSIELLNSFVFGNYLSVAAMTRSLIECYIFAKILKQEKSQSLIDEWWICNMIQKAVVGDKVDKNILNIVKDYCGSREIDFQNKWEYYTTKARTSSGWLKELMGVNGIGISALCKYIGEEDVYNDYQNASNYVHGQDITTKMSPFAFYSSIYIRLCLMMEYIFRTIRLFDVDVEIEAEIENLADGLVELGKKYLK